jgi:homoserine dehydrogenase
VATLANGDVLTLKGRGAGRWPTAEAVLGDVIELAHAAAREDAQAGQLVK